MTRNEARDYFRSKGLSYNNISLRDLQYLKVLLDEQFLIQQKESLANGWNRGYWVRVNDAKYFKGKYAENGALICAHLTGKGDYFSAREVISFNEDGYIGFCGAADDNNAEPVLKAFCEWCDFLCQPKEE